MFANAHFLLRNRIPAGEGRADTGRDYGPPGVFLGRVLSKDAALARTQLRYNGRRPVNSVSPPFASISAIEIQLLPGRFMPRPAGLMSDRAVYS